MDDEKDVITDSSTEHIHERDLDLNDSDITDTRDHETDEPSDDDTSDEPMIPKHRLDEESSKRREAEDKLRVREEELSKTRTTSTPKSQDYSKQALKEVRELREKMEIREVMEKYPDARDFRSKMAEIVKQKPSISWEDAYKLATFEDKQKEAEEKGREDAYKNIDKKVSSSVERAQKKNTRSTPNIEELLADKSVPLSEIEKLFPSERIRR